MFITKLII
ncbi:hypothetical protein LINPERPRIM_LOCUS16693 [Linum perenne]